MCQTVGVNSVTVSDYMSHQNSLSVPFHLRYLHPEGLPSDYTITVLFRLLPETPQEPFALWEVLNKDNEPLVGLILDSESGSRIPMVSDELSETDR